MHAKAHKNVNAISQKISTIIDHDSRYKRLTEFLLTPESNKRNNVAKIDQTKKVEKGCEIYHGRLEKFNIPQQNKIIK